MHILTFLDGFLELFPEYRKAELYLTGEAYASAFTASLALLLLKQSDNKSYPKLSGIAVGSPWLNPAFQYPSFIQFGKKHGLLHGIFLV